MMKNNYTYIKPFLIFDSPDEFYFLQILKRRKDNPGMSKDSRVVKTYFVSSCQYLKSKLDEIESLCKENNARAYIHLNRRSSKQIVVESIKYFAELLSHPNPTTALLTAMEHIAGKINGEPKNTKTWVVDVDYTDKYTVDEVRQTLTETFSLDVAQIPTKNGFHLICRPFDRVEFWKIKSEYTLIDIHQDNPTLLMFNE